MVSDNIEIESVTFNEEIKKIRTNIKFSSINEDVKVICVTSSLPGEGKSLISANLAASFAQYDEKVLLIDCDLRKGRQGKLFNIPINIIVKAIVNISGIASLPITGAIIVYIINKPITTKMFCQHYYLLFRA